MERLALHLLDLDSPLLDGRVHAVNERRVQSVSVSDDFVIWSEVVVSKLLQTNDGGVQLNLPIVDRSALVETASTDVS